MGIYKHEINNISKFELKKLSEFLKDDLGIKNKAEIKEKNNDGSYKAIIKMDSKDKIKLYNFMNCKHRGNKHRENKGVER